MAGRPPNPNMQYIVRLHLDKNKYRYASTVIKTTSPKSGKIYNKYINWGLVTDNLKFIPLPKYILASKEEKSKLIFPDNWDMSEVNKHGVNYGDAKNNESVNERHDVQENQEDSEREQSKEIISTEDCSEETSTKTVKESGNNMDTQLESNNQEKDSKEEHADADSDFDTGTDYQNKLYGAFWILENLAINYGVYEDLLEVFDGNIFLVHVTISLAIFPYLTKRTFNRFAKWQRSNKTLIESELNSAFITRFTQSITDNHRMELIKRRIKRQPSKAHVSCDSSTRSGYGKLLAELRWGKNKDDDNLPVTLEVTVYSLTTHEPIYYRTFAGNTVDMSTVRIILSDLKELKADDIFFIFDRGYISNHNIALFHAAGLPFMMCAKTGQKPVSSILSKVQYDEDGLPNNLEYDSKFHCYYGQFDIPPFKVNMDDDSKETVDGLKANIFVNMQKRYERLSEIKEKIKSEEDDLIKKQSESYIPLDIKKFDALYVYHKVTLEDFEETDSEGKTISVQKLVFSRNEAKISKEKSQAGVFSSVIYKLSLNAKDALIAYKERDEHEKNWNQMKCQMEFNTQDNSSEDGKDGRRFILFVGLILMSKLKSGWKNTELSMQYNSVYDVIDEMESIRYCEYKNNPSKMTTFNEKQVHISMSLGVDPPDECIPPTLLARIKKQRKKQEQEENSDKTKLEEAKVDETQM